jgi:hypothetical protein
VFLGLQQLAYTPVIQASLGLWRCRQRADGGRSFEYAPHLDCDSEKWSEAQYVSWACLAIWGIGIPIGMGLLLHKKHGKPIEKYNFSLVAYGYKESHVYWESWEVRRHFSGIPMAATHSA